jgi:hypothetical protein
MNIITSRPILQGQKSNFSHTSNFDDFANCCGMSGFDDSFSNADEGTKGANVTAVKEYLGQQKKARGKARGEAVVDVLSDKTIAKDLRRTNRATARDSRQSERALRIEARHTRRTNRKASKNAKKLTLVKTSRGDKFFFPLSRVRLGKKKYKDGTEAKVKTEDQITVIDPKTQETVVLDKKEIANVLDKPVAEVTTPDAQKMIEQLNLEIAELKRLQLETGDKSNENPYGVLVDDSKIEVTEDGEAYLKNQTQDKDKKDEDIKLKENGLTKTQKIVLWSAGVVVVGIVGFLIYRAVKNKQ